MSRVNQTTRETPSVVFRNSYLVGNVQAYLLASFTIGAAMLAFMLESSSSRVDTGILFFAFMAIVPAVMTIHYILKSRVRFLGSRCVFGLVGVKNRFYQIKSIEYDAVIKIGYRLCNGSATLLTVEGKNNMYICFSGLEFDQLKQVLFILRDLVGREKFGKKALSALVDAEAGRVHMFSPVDRAAREADEIESEKIGSLFLRFPYLSGVRVNSGFSRGLLCRSSSLQSRAGELTRACLYLIILNLLFNR